MKCHVSPLPRPSPLASPKRRPSASCISFLHRVSFRSRRHRLACGAALFRAYRMCACARVRAGAVRAPDCARERRRAHFSRPFRWGFFAPVRGKRRSGLRMPLPPCLILPRFYRGQAPTGNYFIFHERIAASGRKRRDMSCDVMFRRPARRRPLSIPAYHAFPHVKPAPNPAKQWTNANATSSLTGPGRRACSDGGGCGRETAAPPHRNRPSKESPLPMPNLQCRGRPLSRKPVPAGSPRHGSLVENAGITTPSLRTAAYVKRGTGKTRAARGPCYHAIEKYSSDRFATGMRGGDSRG